MYPEYCSNVTFALDASPGRDFIGLMTEEEEEEDGGDDLDDTLLPSTPELRSEMITTTSTTNRSPGTLQSL